LLADIPVKVIGGVEYYEFRVDLNENNSSAGKLVSTRATPPCNGRVTGV